MQALLGTCKLQYLSIMVHPARARIPLAGELQEPDVTYVQRTFLSHMYATTCEKQTHTSQTTADYAKHNVRVTHVP